MKTPPGAARTCVTPGMLPTERRWNFRIATFHRVFRAVPAPGCSASHYESGSKGTLGLIVEPNVPDGKAYILSCSHVIAMSGLGNVGDAIWQPSPWDGGTSKDQVANLSTWVPFDFSSVGHPNRVDAAIAEATPQRLLAS